ncbi:MAG TPA: Rieske (2Fe-2S) protein, partial [Pseudonocardiaceae bacterium]|nr:Rieske (2Fe-2S) protein [Pseudonocardiaceae bacterium]
MVRDRIPWRRLPAWTWAEQVPTWRDARPGLIEETLKRAQARPSGNWYVLAASREIHADRPFGRTIAGIEVVAWRTPDGALHAGPGECPHLGAPLCRAAVTGGNLVCRWHGLAIGAG